MDLEKITRRKDNAFERIKETEEALYQVKENNDMKILKIKNEKLHEENASLRNQLMILMNLIDEYRDIAEMLEFDLAEVKQLKIDLKNKTERFIAYSISNKLEMTDLSDFEGDEI